MYYAPHNVINLRVVRTGYKHCVEHPTRQQRFMPAQSSSDSQVEEQFVIFSTSDFSTDDGQSAASEDNMPEIYNNVRNEWR